MEQNHVYLRIFPPASKSSVLGLSAGKTLVNIGRPLDLNSSTSWAVRWSYFLAESLKTQHQWRVKMIDKRAYNLQQSATHATANTYYGIGRHIRRNARYSKLYLHVFFSFIRLVTPNFFSIIRFPVLNSMLYTPSRANILVTPGLQKLQEVGFNASPGLKQIYNWSCTHLLPRKFKISSFLKLETCFRRRVASTPNSAQMTKFGHFGWSLAAKVAWWPPIFFSFFEYAQRYLIPVEV